MEHRYETSRTGNYSILKELAKQNRRNPTVAESILWQYLRGKQLGTNFRRQHPIDDYIVDFVCLEKLLIIEVDGKYHFQGDIPEYDAQRTAVLNRLGYEVLRFDNDSIVNEIDKVLERIKNKIRK